MTIIPLLAASLVLGEAPVIQISGANFRPMPLAVAAPQIQDATAKSGAAACTHASGGISVSTGTGMSAFGLAAAVRKPWTVDARYTAQGAHRAWSPPV